MAEFLPNGTRFALASALALGLALGCGPVVPHGGVRGGAEAAHRLRPRTIEANELIPADLDLVIRLDLARVRADLGPLAARRALEQGGQAVDPTGRGGAARAALASAEVVWLGVRLSDLREGDRVMVVEGPSAASFSPDARAWTSASTDIDGVRRWRAAHAALRADTAEIVALGRAAAFVSPVEAMSVRRVLWRGPDPERGDPEARGLLSLDYRPRRISPDLARRYAALARLVRGVARLRAVIDVTGRQLVMAARIRCTSQRAAARVARFLSSFREVGAGAAEAGPAKLLASLQIAQAERVVTVRWPVAADELAPLWQDAQNQKAQAAAPP